jgi:hypothetical protein
MQNAKYKIQNVPSPPPATTFKHDDAGRQPDITVFSFFPKYIFSSPEVKDFLQAAPRFLLTFQRLFCFL